MGTIAAPPDLTKKLLMAIGAGDDRAFRLLYDATSTHLLGILIGILGRRDLAEEALQECFIKIWQKAGSYDPARGQAMAWLTTLVRNKAVDLIRARRPDESGLDFETTLEMWADESADPCRDAENAQRLSLLGKSLAALSPKMRKSVLLTCHSGYTHEECAELMCAPLGTTKSWVRRGLMQMRCTPSALGSIA